MENKSYESLTNDIEGKSFEWRKFARDYEKVPAELAVKLDELTELVNTSPDGQEFIRALANDQYRKPLLSLVQFFRDILTPEERSELFDAIESVNKTG